jgi:hypothetical protein
LEGIERADKNAYSRRKAGVTEFLGKASKIEGGKAPLANFAVYPRERILEQGAEIIKIVEFGFA